MTERKIKRYCEGIDCAWCNQEEPCIYRIANKYLQTLIEIKEIAEKSIREGSMISGGWLYQKIKEITNE